MSFQPATHVMQELLKDAVDKQGMTKNEVARICGLTPTTVIRLLEGGTERLHPRTVRAVAGAFGYEAEIREDNKVRLSKRTHGTSTKLTAHQKNQIIQAVTEAVRGALDNF